MKGKTDINLCCIQHLLITLVYGPHCYLSHENPGHTRPERRRAKRAESLKVCVCWDTFANEGLSMFWTASSALNVQDKWKTTPFTNEEKYFMQRGAKLTGREANWERS